ncbi:hypothetical protein [Providencia sp.]|uniref:hypothetical protein n=1 Tax=Providencia sp. TaxID=589 RepID=UPI003F9CE28D
MTLNAARDIDLQAASVQSKGTITALSGRNIGLLASAYTVVQTPQKPHFVIITYRIIKMN